MQLFEKKDNRHLNNYAKHFIHISFYVVFDSIGFHLQLFLRFIVLSFIQTMSGIFLEEFACEMGGQNHSFLFLCAGI